jgi:hypothetical protein
MSWWKRLFGEPGNASSGVEGVLLDLSMPVVERSPSRTVWRDSDGDIVSLDVVKGQDLPNPLTPDTVQAFFREMAEDRQGGLVEARILERPSGEAVEGIYKRRQGTGFVFTGMLIMPVRHASLVWTIVAGEHGTTGVREAVVSAQMFTEGSLTVDAYKRSWAQDPYDAQYRAQGRVDMSTLRYMSDDARFDSQFPNHPLSKIRRGLQTILAEARIDEAVVGAA